MTHNTYETILFSNGEIGTLAESVYLNTGFIFIGFTPRMKDMMSRNIPGFDPHKLRLVPSVCFYESYVTLNADIKYRKVKHNLKVVCRSISIENITVLIRLILEQIERIDK